MSAEEGEKIVLVVIILFLDQFSKFLATKFLSLNQSRQIIDKVFYLTLIHNRGAAFGILKGHLPLFILTSIIAIVLIYFNLKGKREQKIYNFSLSLILAGGLGNLIDRLLNGHVIDFLDFRIWPVFNIADSAITIGVVLLGLTILRSKKST